MSVVRNSLKLSGDDSRFWIISMVVMTSWAEFLSVVMSMLKKEAWVSMLATLGELWST